MPQLYLSLRPGQGLGPFKGVAIMMLVHQVDQAFSGICDNRPVSNTRTDSWGHPHTDPKREYRVQYRADRTRQGLPRGDDVGYWFTSSRHEPRPVRFILEGRNGIAF